MHTAVFYFTKEHNCFIWIRHNGAKNRHWTYQQFPYTGDHCRRWVYIIVIMSPRHAVQLISEIKIINTSVDTYLIFFSILVFFIHRRPRIIFRTRHLKCTERAVPLTPGRVPKKDRRDVSNGKRFALATDASSSHVVIHHLACIF